MRLALRMPINSITRTSILENEVRVAVDKASPLHLPSLVVVVCEVALNSPQPMPLGICDAIERRVHI